VLRPSLTFCPRLAALDGRGHGLGWRRPRPLGQPRV
jgi:hypothetical protein